MASLGFSTGSGSASAACSSAWFPNGINVEVATQDAFGIVTEDHAAIDGDAAGVVLESFGQVLGQVIAGDEGFGFIRANVGAVGAVGGNLGDNIRIKAVRPADINGVIIPVVSFDDIAGARSIQQGDELNTAADLDTKAELEAGIRHAAVSNRGGGEQIIFGGRSKITNKVEGDDVVFFRHKGLLNMAYLRKLVIRKEKIKRRG